jgi:hypothetical protein
MRIDIDTRNIDSLQLRANRTTYVEVLNVNGVRDRRPVESRGIEELDLPAGTCSFQFHDSIIITGTVDGTIALEPIVQDCARSPLYCYGGTPVGREVVEREAPHLLAALDGHPHRIALLWTAGPQARIHVIDHLNALAVDPETRAASHFPTPATSQKA